MNMHEILDRIDKLAKERGISLSALSVQSGMSKDGIRNWKRRLEKEKSFGVSHSNLKGVAEALGVSIERLTSSPVSVPKIITPDHPPPNGSSLVPIYDVAAAAGAGIVVDDYEAIAANLAFPPNYLHHITKTHPSNLAIISVTGGSMLPTLAHDDIVMVDTTKKNTAFDGIFVVRVDGLLKVKRVRKSQQPGCITLKSDNPTYPDEDVGLHDFEVIGRVVWMGTKAL